MKCAYQRLSLCSASVDHTLDVPATVAWPVAVPVAVAVAVAVAATFAVAVAVPATGGKSGEPTRPDLEAGVGFGLQPLDV